MTDTPRVVVISPTYNEADNVHALADGVLAQPGDLSLLVVDDSSPDGTGDRVLARAANDPRIGLLTRPGKEGYGRAVCAGLVEALDRGADVVVQLDADGSHDPAVIPCMLDAIAAGFDVVIGSRYVPGGGIRRWPPRRKILSRGANAYVDRVLGLPVRDCTTGFRAFTADALRRCDPREVRASGYAFLIEHLYLADQADLRIEEVPIVFTDREEGESSLTWSVFTESVVNPWRIRLSRRR